MKHLGAAHDGLNAAGIAVTSVDADGKVQPANLQASATTWLATFDDSVAAETQRRLVADRAAIIAALANGGLTAKELRGLMLVLLDEFNLHAAKINAILDASDAAINLADFKTRMAAIVDYPQRTKAQLITAITNKANAGDLDG